MIKKFAVISGRFDGAKVGASVSRDMVPENMAGFEACNRFASRREANAEAKRRADFGAPNYFEMLILRHKGRRGWIVVDVLEGAIWEDED